MGCLEVEEGLGVLRVQKLGQHEHFRVRGCTRSGKLPIGSTHRSRRGSDG